MLRKIRISIATVVFLLITLLFLDFTGTLHLYLGWLAKIQLLPAILALNVGVVAALIGLTLFFGRIYCSVICPLGILQDVFACFNRKKNHYSYSPAKNILRYIVLAVFIVLIIAGFGSLAGLLAPYSSFGRIAQNIMQPAYVGINNLFAMTAEHYGSYAFYHSDVWVRSVPTLAIAMITLIVLIVLAWHGGRTYCNTICPVGTVLGFVSRFSGFQIRIDTDHCKNCGKCARNCKAACIDFKNHTVDYSRCVTCGNCLEQCSFGAMSYKFQRRGKVRYNVVRDTDGKIDLQRRTFLIGTGIAITSAALAQEKKKVDGGLAVIEDKIQPERSTRLTPPGAISAKHFQQHCTACQLCVSECPNDVLRPSTELTTFMQPTMSYERGYCRPECNRCSNICPTGAIKPITLADKSSTQIGHAVWVKKNCIPVAEGHECGNCERHCPTGAIQMVHPDGDESKPKIPAVNESRCIGCGACENLCPARPFSAIYVEGHEVHKFN